MYRITYPRNDNVYDSMYAEEIYSLEPADPSETGGRLGLWEAVFYSSRRPSFGHDAIVYLDRNSSIEIVGEKRYAVLDGRVTEYDDGVKYGYGAFARLARILAEESVMKALEVL